jgi:hypothetical protein
MTISKLVFCTSILLTIGVISGCTDNSGKPKGVSADQWPSISGEFDNRLGEISERHGMKNTGSKATQMATGPKVILVASKTDKENVYPSEVVSKAVQIAQKNRDEYRIDGKDVLVGRARFSSQSRNHDFVVIYGQPTNAKIMGPRMNPDVTEFIFWMTGCEIVGANIQQDNQTLPLASTVVFPISCDKI